MFAQGEHLRWGFLQVNKGQVQAELGLAGGSYLYDAIQNRPPEALGPQVSQR
jgi:hypothetical protein